MAEISAIGVSITCNLNGDRQVVLQAHIASDAVAADKSALLDELNLLVDRQKAKYELPALLEEYEIKAATVARAEEDLAALDKRLALDEARLKVEAETYEADRKAAFDEGYNGHVLTGRVGAFEPKGHVKSKIDRLDAAARGVRETIAKAQAERGFAVENLEKSLTRFRADLDVVFKKIAAAQALLDGS